MENAAFPVGFYSIPDLWQYWLFNQYTYTDFQMYASGVVGGFFGGLMPMDVLLVSTLDCLYDLTCLELLLNYFPAVNQVCMPSFYLP
jgi:hypothetical protein